MARENITAGASTLAAMSQNVANMGQIRQNMIAGTTQALNNVGNSFLQWQDDFNKRKYQKWMQGMEEAKFAHQKDTDAKKIDLAQQSVDMEREKLSHTINDLIAGAKVKNANAYEINSRTNFDNKQRKYIEKNNLMGEVIRSQYTTTKGTGDSTAAGTQPKATQGTKDTGNGVEITNPADSSLGVVSNFNNAQQMTDKDKAQLAATIDSTLPKYN